MMITRYKSKKERARSFSVLALLGLALLLNACSVSTIDIVGSYPSPLISKLPLTIGVYYPLEFTSHSYTEIDDFTGNDQYIINSGSSQVELFNTVLPALFQEVVMLDNLDSAPADNQLDAVFVPAIEEFQVGLPSKTKLEVYEVWMKYNMRLSSSGGDNIADWVMTAYGKTPTESFQSVSEGVNDAAVVAMRDLAASFALGFSNIPEVNEWLTNNNYLTE